MVKIRIAVSLASALLILSQNGFAEEEDFAPKEVQLNTQQPEKKVRSKSPTVKAAFSPFTGKVNGDRVRLRLQPDLDGYIVKELGKNEFVSVIDQEGDFYSINPPESMKAYIFRSFVLDNIVEGNRVNVRLEPDLESPVIGHLNSGDRVEGEVSSINRKWLEIAPPSTTRFYVAKHFIEFAGGPEFKEQMQARKETVAQLLTAAKLYADSELEKTFEEIDFENIKQGFLTIIHDYTDFPKQAEKAKEMLAHVQEDYLQKRIAYLEKKAALVTSFASETNGQGEKKSSTLLPTMQMWEPIEEALYASWTERNGDKAKDEFYNEEKMVATAVTGVLEAFTSPVRNKPGDFVVKNKNLPVAYVYSTKVDLKDYVGKKVTLIGSPRENHSFAFPAYFVHEVE